MYSAEHPRHAAQVSRLTVPGKHKGRHVSPGPCSCSHGIAPEPRAVPGAQAQPAAYQGALHLSATGNECTWLFQAPGALCGSQPALWGGESCSYSALGETPLPTPFPQ